MSEIKMEISKTAVLLANKHHSGQKKWYKHLSYTFFPMESFTQNYYAN